MAKEREPDGDSGSIEKMEAIIERGVRLKKGIAMGGLEKTSNVDHGAKAPKMPKPSGLVKRNRSAY